MFSHPPILKFRLALVDVSSLLRIKFLHSQEILAI
jgi:hypothetical protein